MNNDNNEEKNQGGELSVSEKGLTVKGDAYEDLRPLIKAGVGVGTPILQTMANTLLIAQGWINVRLEGVAKRYDVKLMGIPDIQRQLPPPEITAAVINRTIYAQDDSALHELFAELLTSASDNTRDGQAHVAFATMISEMEPLDGKIITLFRRSRIQNMLYAQEIKQKFEIDREDTLFREAIGNLRRLGLIDFIMRVQPRSIDSYSSIEKTKIEEMFNDIQSSMLNHSKSKDNFELTPLGKRFLEACVAVEKEN